MCKSELEIAGKISNKSEVAPPEYAKDISSKMTSQQVKAFKVMTWCAIIVCFSTFSGEILTISEYFDNPKDLRAFATYPGLKHIAMLFIGLNAVGAVVAVSAAIAMYKRVVRAFGSVAIIAFACFIFICARPVTEAIYCQLNIPHIGIMDYVKIYLRNNILEVIGTVMLPLPLVVFLLTSRRAMRELKSPKVNEVR